MNKQTNITPDAEEQIEAAIEKTESYIEKNFKGLLIGVGAVIVIAAAIWGFNQNSDSAAQEASEAVFVAEQYFQQDSFALALNGGEGFIGFLDVADQFGSSTVGNIANHYAGICYYKLGDMDNALASLAKYKAVKGLASSVINSQNLGLQGDASSQKGDYAAAIVLYESAAAINNDFTAPFYLKKAGLLYEKDGNNAKALESYNKIKNQYPSSAEAREIDKFIGRVSQGKF